MSALVRQAWAESMLAGNNTTSRLSSQKYADLFLEILQHPTKKGPPQIGELVVMDGPQSWDCIGYLVAINGTAITTWSCHQRLATRCDLSILKSYSASFEPTNFPRPRIKE